jgi:glycosyltransferase involved in cell wall biosynthesis
MVHERFPEKTNYIPHALPKDLYKPLPDDEVKTIKKSLLGAERLDHFVVGYVSRNARRKMPSDIILSWKMFLDQLKEKHGHKKATLVMHTDPLDPEGPNLFQVVDMLGLADNVVFSNRRVNFQEMNAIYNTFDTIVNRSSNEGFGLPTLEAAMCGKPIIAIKTGGLTRQVVDHVTGEMYGIGIDPETRSLVGNQNVPYIFEDLITHKTLAESFMKMYDLGPEERKQLGIKTMNHAHRDYDLDKVVGDWDSSLTKLMDSWKQNRTTWTHTEF